jgi:Tol biopolymer transport system component
MIPIIFLVLNFFVPSFFSNFGSNKIYAINTTTSDLKTLTSPGIEATITENIPIIFSATKTIETIASSTLTPTFYGTPIGGGSGQIAFASIVNEVPQIILMNLDGSHKTPLTNLQAGACQPAWSPDGLKLVFISPCLGEESVYEGASLYILDVKTGMVTPLPSFPGGDFDPAWSPAGNQIAFSSLRDGAKPHIFILDLDLGTNPLRLSPMVAYDRAPAWSPDESKIAFISTRGGFQQIWLMDLDGSGVREFSLLESGKTDDPSWSPDGKLIIYSKGNPAGAILATRSTIQLDAGEIELDRDVFPAHKPVFSRDGFWLFCESNGEIYRMDINGNNPINLTNSTSSDFDPAIRP